MGAFFGKKKIEDFHCVNDEFTLTSNNYDAVYECIKKNSNMLIRICVVSLHVDNDDLLNHLNESCLYSIEGSTGESKSFQLIQINGNRIFTFLKSKQPNVIEIVHTSDDDKKTAYTVYAKSITLKLQKKFIIDTECKETKTGGKKSKKSVKKKNKKKKSKKKKSVKKKSKKKKSMKKK